VRGDALILHLLLITSASTDITTVFTDITSVQPVVTSALPLSA
jgi:hypothetical protein